MVRDIIREYPDLGSFLYGHWEDVELTAAVFLILTGVLFSLLFLLVFGGIVGYVLQSIAISRIAKRQGAWRNIRIMACFPFVRHFALGKVAERCDVLQAAEKRRLWGRMLLICSCILIPVAVVALIVALIGLPGTQLFAMIAEDGGSFLWDSDSKFINAVTFILYLLLVLIALPIIFLALVSEEAFALTMIVLPFAGIVGLLLGVVLMAVIRTLSGKCYYKVLRMYFADKTALVLTVIGQITGLTSIALFVASLKKRTN